MVWLDPKTEAQYKEKIEHLTKKFNGYLHYLDEMNARLGAQNTDLWDFIEMLAKEDNSENIKSKTVQFLSKTRRSRYHAYEDELLEEGR